VRRTGHRAWTFQRDVTGGEDVDKSLGGSRCGLPAATPLLDRVRLTIRHGALVPVAEEVPSMTLMLEAPRVSPPGTAANEVAAPRVFIDKECPAVYAAFVETSKAVRTMAIEAGLDRLMVELVNLRVSQINGCAYCLDVHAVAALRAGETLQRLAVLPAWQETDLFSPREQAALALAESVTELPTTLDQDAAYAFALARLRRDEVAAIVWIAITMNGFNRISILSRHPVRPPRTADKQS
jgi:AhpD family alkylhydroperoxidase